MLAVGLASGAWLLAPRGRKNPWNTALNVAKIGGHHFVSFGCLFDGLRLVQSYSRAAWLGMNCGLAYLFWSNRRRLKFKIQSWRIPWIVKNKFSVSFILASFLVLAFWHFRQTDEILFHRAVSSVNPVDFSWRNRISAWEGTFQIAAEHPWFGVGWSQIEPCLKTIICLQNQASSRPFERIIISCLAPFLDFPLCFVLECISGCH